MDDKPIELDSVASMLTEAVEDAQKLMQEFNDRYPPEIAFDAMAMAVGIWCMAPKDDLERDILRNRVMRAMMYAQANFELERDA